MDHTARNVILQLRRLQFGKVTQGHTAGQLNRQHLISGFLILSSVFYTLLSSLIGYQTSLFVLRLSCFKIESLASQETCQSQANQRGQSP